MTLLALLALLVTGILAVILGIAVYNAVAFPRLRIGDQPPEMPMTSALIPARNEALVIADTVRALLDQAPPALEVCVLDDASTDGTTDVVRAAGGGDSHFRVLSGSPLPAGWLGKNWACRQLADAARGEVLVFTDAEVRWQPGALSAVLAELERTGADLLGIWPTQETVTWPERLVVPLIALGLQGYAPVALLHSARWPMVAAANGQALVFRRASYEAMGGHDAVRDEVLEDVRLARCVKDAGLRLRLVDAAGLVRCRMYRDWPTTRDGIAKSTMAGFGNRTVFIVASVIFHLTVFVGPWLWLAAGAFGATGAGWPWWPLALVGAGIAARMITAAVTGQRVRDGLLLPVSVLAMTVIALRALWWHWRFGGPVWKGRVATTTSESRR